MTHRRATCIALFSDYSIFGRHIVSHFSVYLLLTLDRLDLPLLLLFDLKQKLTVLLYTFYPNHQGIRCFAPIVTSFLLKELLILKVLSVLLFEVDDHILFETIDVKVGDRAEEISFQKLCDGGYVGVWETK